MWKKIKFYTVSAIILALGGACLYLYWFGGRRAVVRRVVDPPAVVREIQELSELVTVRYRIQKVVGLEEEKVPFGSERILLLVQGDVLGGVDLSLLSTNDVQVTAEGAVIARLPQPKVMHVYLDEQQTRVGTARRHGGHRGCPDDPELETKVPGPRWKRSRPPPCRWGFSAMRRTTPSTPSWNGSALVVVESVRFTTSGEGGALAP